MKYSKSIGQSVRFAEDDMGTMNVLTGVHYSHIEFYCEKCNEYYDVKEAKKRGI